MMIVAITSNIWILGKTDARKGRLMLRLGTVELNTRAELGRMITVMKLWVEREGHSKGLGKSVKSRCIHFKELLKIRKFQRRPGIRKNSGQGVKKMFGITRS